MKFNTPKILPFFLLMNLGLAAATSAITPLPSPHLNAPANPVNHVMVEAAEAYGILANNFAELGLINEASASNHATIQILKNLNNNNQITHRFFQLADAYFSTGNTREALKNYYAVYRLAERHGSAMDLQAKSLFAIAKVYQEQGQKALATALENQAQSLLKNLQP